MNFVRRGVNSAYTSWHTRVEEKLPFLPLSKILEIQQRRVRSIVRHAYDTVPYYREVMDAEGLRPSDMRSAEDLARLPILEREELAKEPKRFRSNRFSGRQAVELHTAGSSGYSKYVTYDPPAVLLALAHGHRQRIVCAHFVGRRFGYREMQVDRKGGVSDRLRAFYEKRLWVPGRVDLHRATMDPADSFDESIRKINRYRPDVIGGVGSYIGRIYRYAWEQGIGLHPPKLIRYGGTVLPEADRRLLEEVFNVPVISLYQAVEALRIGYQCEQREGLHLHLDSVAVRVVDGNGRDVGPGGSGDLVLSNLVNRATVLLNYRLGDVVTRGRMSCACGRTLPTLERVAGRSEELIQLPGDRRMYVNSAIEACTTVPGFVQAQLIQEEMRRFTFRVVFQRDMEWEKAKRVIDTELRTILGQDIRLRIDRLDSIPSGPGGKVHSLVSRLPTSARNGSGGL